MTGLQAKDIMDWFLALTVAASAFVLVTFATDPVAAHCVSRDSD
jgi:Na+-transporting NADH:ubiquinone oxidoreductase subunit NqrB